MNTIIKLSLIEIDFSVFFKFVNYIITLKIFQITKPKSIKQNNVSKDFFFF